MISLLTNQKKKGHSKSTWKWIQRAKKKKKNDYEKAKKKRSHGSAEREGNHGCRAKRKKRHRAWDTSSTQQEMRRKSLLGKKCVGAGAGRDQKRNIKTALDRSAREKRCSHCQEEERAGSQEKVGSADKIKGRGKQKPAPEQGLKVW